MPTLHEKYDRFLPRYTSYPPANHFHSYFTDKEFIKEIVASNDKKPEHLSFYFHVPFCRQMCHYCGCNSVRLNDDNEVKAYGEALHAEMKLIFPLLSSSRKVSQIHFGGGTPSTISIEAIQSLIREVFNHFEPIDSPEIAIECHPGYMDEAFLSGLKKDGFNRISLGIQDFDPEVLKIVNRCPSRMPVSDIIDFVHHEMKASVNLDFIYGLPKQTPDSFLRNMEKALQLVPDRIVLFPYAHLPQLFKRQEMLEKTGLPSHESKIKMFEKAASFLKKQHYCQVGMDHFVLPGDELNKAKKAKQLHRNFQGYCSGRTTGQVYAFGVSGISQLATCYAQNTKDISAYLSSVSSGHLAIEKGYVLSPEERITRELIESLMCNYSIKWTEIGKLTGIAPDKVRNLVWMNKEELAFLHADGIIETDENGIEVTETGKPFVRNVAVCFDRLFQGYLK